MRVTILAAGGALALGLAGCGSPTAPPTNQTAADPQSTENQITSLAEGQRNGVFIRAIRDAGLDCQHVESSAPAGSHEGFPLWRATCEGGRSYTLVIGNAGTVQILDDAAARLVGNETAPINVQE